MINARDMVSVGIDIGTTTTQVIFSQLTLVDVARAGQIPRIDIADRKALYRSEIVFTPLLDAETIDATRLSAIIKLEYERAGVLPSQVETGAVIITGETAKKKNASEILRAIAGLAGDFVVTVAGPHVESLIAGRGSGAAAYSRQHFTSVTNVDIGGGSSNSAIFKQGNMIAAAAMNYGGRMVIIDHYSGRIRHLAQPALWMLEMLGLRLAVGDAPALGDLARLTRCMADLTLELIEGTASSLARKVYLTSPSPVSGKGRTLMFSGGIGYYYYHPISLNSVSDVTRHDDIGPLLAESIRQQPEIQAYSIQEPLETLHATVLGASSQMITLSGSTIWAEENILPLKNIPVIRPLLEGRGKDFSGVEPSILAALQRWDLAPASDIYAVALELEYVLDYNDLVELAGRLYDFSRILQENRPLIVIIKRDYARALGQTLKALVGGRPLLVIDQVGLEEGDYIDIGAPVMDGRVVPLSIKTLIFYH